LQQTLQQTANYYNSIPKTVLKEWPTSNHYHSTKKRSLHLAIFFFEWEIFLDFKTIQC